VSNSGIVKSLIAPSINLFVALPRLMLFPLFGLLALQRMVLLLARFLGVD
jgi:hypothetical protein